MLQIALQHSTYAGQKLSVLLWIICHHQNNNNKRKMQIKPLINSTISRRHILAQAVSIGLWFHLWNEISVISPGWIFVRQCHRASSPCLQVSSRPSRPSTTRCASGVSLCCLVLEPAERKQKWIFIKYILYPLAVFRVKKKHQ